MSDPFRPQANNQLVREARIGLTILAVTLGVFSYIAYQRISGAGTRIPEHVMNAPIAQTVWPGEDPTQLALKESEADSDSTFGSLISKARKSFGLNFENRKPGSQVRVNQKRYFDPGSSVTQSSLPRTPDSLERESPRAMNLELVNSKRNQEQELPEPDEVVSQRKIAKLPLDQNGLRSRGANSVAKNSRHAFSRVENSAGFHKRMAVQASNDEPVETKVSSKVTHAFATEPEPRSNSSFPKMAGSAPKQELRPLPVNIKRDLPSESEGDFVAPTPQPIKTEFAKTKTKRLPKSTLPKLSVPQPETIEASRGNRGKPGTALRVQVESDGKDNKMALANVSSPEPELKTDSDTKRYTVQFGDSFWSIAQSVYDEGRLYRALYEYNRSTIGNYENLTPGATLNTPSRTELEKLFPELCPRDNQSAVVTDVDERIHVTKEGDTLFEIARQRYGQASEYLEIQKANTSRLGQDVTHLTPLPEGIRLILPMQIQ